MFYPSFFQKYFYTSYRNIFLERAMQQEIQKLWELIKTSEKILLINHIRMDGDAWGSLCGLALVLKNMGKNVEWINDSEVPESLQFLWHNDIINPELDVKTFNPDFIISLDAGDAMRLWESYIKWKEVFDTKPFVMIDHHVSNPLFGDINILDIEAWSTAELLVDILERLELSTYISPEAATCFYTGIQTDSNMYFNTNTTAKALRVGARLIELGADFRLPITECFKKKSFTQMKLWQCALKNMKQDFGGRLTYSYITSEDLEQNGISLKDTSEYMKGFINEVLINISGTNIAFLLYPLSGTEQKASLRSQVGYDVNALCQIFWWGWHIQASGFQKIDSRESVIEELVSEIKKVLK